MHIGQNTPAAEPPELANTPQHERRETSQRLHERALDASASAVVISRADAPDYPVEYVNPAFERLTGYAAADVIGRSLHMLHAGDADQPGIGELCAALRECRAGRAILRNYRRDGSLVWTEVELSPVRGEDGAVSHFIAITSDISETRRYQAELEFHASRDALTGLPNRTLLYDRANQAIACGSRYGRAVWIVAANLDRFSLLTSALGHQGADAILRVVAERLSAAVRSSDTVARVGGDEFVIVMQEHADRLEPRALQRLLDAITCPFAAQGHEIVLSARLGVAAYPADGGDADTLIRHAGVAMQRAKELGRNRFQFYTSEMNDRALERLRMMADLREALARGEFVLHYQPQVEFRGGRIVGMEALIRWNHRELGLLGPARFIGLAEESDLICEIGTWAVGAAARQCKAWQQAGYRGLRVAVNLSARQFADERLEQVIGGTLADTGLAAHCLDLELTESAVMSEVERSVRIMQRLKALGVQLSIDDFGTGYSSLAYLKNFPVDVLKIDRSFVTGIESDKGNAAIAKAIISMAHTLGMRVIAEGAETESECAFLSRHRCDEMQGYYFSAPLPAQRFEALLRQGRRLPHSVHRDALLPP